MESAMYGTYALVVSEISFVRCTYRFIWDTSFCLPPYWKREDPGQQLVRKYRTFALSMKYSMQLRISSF